MPWLRSIEYKLTVYQLTCVQKKSVSVYKPDLSISSNNLKNATSAKLVYPPQGFECEFSQELILFYIACIEDFTAKYTMILDPGT